MYRPCHSLVFQAGVNTDDRAGCLSIYLQAIDQCLSQLEQGSLGQVHSSRLALGIARMYQRMNLSLTTRCIMQMLSDHLSIERQFCICSQHCLLSQHSTCQRFRSSCGWQQTLAPNFMPDRHAACSTLQCSRHPDGNILQHGTLPLLDLSLAQLTRDTDLLHGHHVYLVSGGVCLRKIRL